MKIEKINENQIRCTLTREDLVSREIKLNELTYGSEKIRLLFRDMMQMASEKCGFEANNTSLMIEAIPISMDSIVLIVTKVEDPDELDARFARYTADDVLSETEKSAPTTDSLTGADDILDLIAKLSKIRKSLTKQPSEAGQAADVKSSEAAVLQEPSATKDTEQNSGDHDEVYHLTRFYLFRDLQTLIRAARVVDPSYTASNSVYKNPEDGNYYLILTKENTPGDVFNRICNTISEYGLAVDYTNGLQELFGEHMKTITKNTALQTLRVL